MGMSQSSKGKAKSCTWGGITPHTSIGWGLPGWKVRGSPVPGRHQNTGASLLKGLSDDHGIGVCDVRGQAESWDCSALRRESSGGDILPMSRNT